MKAFFISLIMFCVFRFNLCDYVIDVDDILSPNYMPTSLLMLENPETMDAQFVNSSVNVKKKYDAPAFGGKFDDAFATMGFHRQVFSFFFV